MGETYQSIVIDAPVEQLWQAIRNFHDMSWAPNVVNRVEPVGDRKGGEPGAVRVLNGTFRETLREIDDFRRRFAYSIDDGPPPVSGKDVSDYIGRVAAHPITEGGGTFIEWSSTWQRNEEATAAFCHGIYVALLQDLKKSLER